MPLLINQRCYGIDKQGEVQFSIGEKAINLLCSPICSPKDSLAVEERTVIGIWDYKRERERPACKEWISFSV